MAFRFDQQKKSSKKGQAPQPPTKAAKNKNDATPVTTPTKLNSLDLSPTDSVASKQIENHGPEWLTTASEEIQTLIAQRHFEDAQSLIKRSQDYLAKDKTVVNGLSIEQKIKDLENNLTNVLLQELSNCHCRNLQVALKASRRCLKILVDMGKARQACGTLLKVCSVALRTSQREARRNNGEISELFFCDLAQVGCEFLSAFEQQPACVSGMYSQQYYLIYFIICVFLFYSLGGLVQCRIAVFCQSIN